MSSSTSSPNGGDESEYTHWSDEELRAADVGRDRGSAEFWYDGNYDKLIKHGADLVEDKVVGIEDLTLPDWGDDDVEMEERTGDVPPEKIQADVEALLEERGVDRDQQAQQKRPTAHPEKIDWAALWDDFDIPRQAQSLAQLGLMAEASPQTSVGESGLQVAEEAAARERLVDRGSKFIPEEWT